jgi:hypothetical protein
VRAAPDRAADQSAALPAPPAQGPPGTGKTRTILNLLSVVMHAAAKGSLELLQAGAMDSSREVRHSSGSASGRLLHLMLSMCACTWACATAAWRQRLQLLSLLPPCS